MGGYTPRDGASKWGALHPSSFRAAACMRAQLRTLGFGYVLSMHMGMSGRPFPRTSEQRRVLGTSDQMTPPHTHTRTLRCTARSSTRSWLDCRAPTSIIHLPTNNIVSNSFLTVLRAEPRCRRTENRFIETRRNETDNYRKWEQGGPWWMCQGVWVKGTKTQVAARPKPRNSEDRF